MPIRSVLAFCVDEMRADHLGCMGNELIKTPALDALAARGTVFRRAHCNNPICMPARATMFTGLLPRDRRPDVATVLVIPSHALPQAELLVRQSHC